MAGLRAIIGKIYYSLFRQRGDETPDRNGGGGDLDTDVEGSIAENNVDASRCDDEMEALTVPSPIRITEPEDESNYRECLPPTSPVDVFRNDDAKTAEAEDTKMVEANDSKTAEAIESNSSERNESKAAEVNEINSLKEPEADEAMAAEPNETEADESEKATAPEPDEPEVLEAVESKGPEANESADPTDITQPEDQSMRGRKRAANWEPEETLKLIERRLQPPLEKGKWEWEAISVQIQGRTRKQCQQRWDTLVKPYKKIKRHCDAHGKDFCQITEEEFRSMKLNIHWRNGDWYNMIDEYYRERKVTAAICGAKYGSRRLYRQLSSAYTSKRHHTVEKATQMLGLFGASLLCFFFTAVRGGQQRKVTETQTNGGATKSTARVSFRNPSGKQPRPSHPSIVALPLSYSFP